MCAAGCVIVGSWLWPGSSWWRRVACAARPRGT